MISLRGLTCQCVTPCCLLLRSVFDHQIMLKGFNFVGGIPEHIVNRAHLEVSGMAACFSPKTSTIKQGLLNSGSSSKWLRQLMVCITSFELQPSTAAGRQACAARCVKLLQAPGSACDYLHVSRSRVTLY
jgi:hypothetical protein